MKRRVLRQAVERYLGARQLVWIGTRGDDVEAVADIPNLAASFSIINAHQHRSAVTGHALEDGMGHRVDLDSFDIDDRPRAGATVGLRRELHRTLAKESAVFTYRPSSFVSGAWFSRQDRCEHLSMFKDHQDAFEHKPWVESCLRGLGVPTIPWRYVTDDDQLDAMRLLDDGPIVLRRKHSTSGTGVVRVESEEQLLTRWPEEDELFVSVAPFYAEAVPVNVGGVVWQDGVTLHPASVQLIGIPTCTVRPFGYCGNDFGALDDLDESSIDEIERWTTVVGEWLRSRGYLGAFGVDYLVDGPRVLFTEINPRFQGSTHLSCRIALEQGESCIMLEHLAALAGMSAPPSRPIGANGVRGRASIAHVVVHRTAQGLGLEDSRPLLRAALAEDAALRVDVTCGSARLLAHGATVGRMTVRDRVTVRGFELVDRWAGVIESASSENGSGATEW